MFLCRYSVIARVIILAGTLILATQHNYIPTNHFTEQYVLWGSLIAVSISPLVCLPYVFALWTKITPIKDRVTYFENELVFLFSVFLGTSFFLYLAQPIHPVSALCLGISLTAVMIPFCVLVWALNSIFAPLSKRDLSEIVKNAQQFREYTPNFWNNVMAYSMAVITSSLTIIFAIFTTSFANGHGIPHLNHVPFMSALTFIFMSIITAPLFILLGRLLIARQSEPSGRH